MSNFRVKFLGQLGDPIEKEGIHTHKLGENFSKYAEFWSKYVQPNRDSSDSSKLRVDFPRDIEDILNHHYGVFYHLTVAFRQIRELSNPIVDIGDPFYHLATAIDLVERTFVTALQVKGELTGNPVCSKLSEEEFKNLANEFWSKTYSQEWERFERNFHPSSIKLHSVGDIFIQQLPSSNVKRNFQTVAGHVRQYRNVLTHSLPPLKLDRGGIKYLPKRDFLHLYRDGNWSSVRDSINPDQYAPANEVIEELAGKLVVCVNDLWDELLAIMSDIVIDDKYTVQIETDTKFFADPESGVSPFKGVAQNEFYAGGTAVLHIRPTGYVPFDVPPSGEWGSPAITKKPNEPTDL